MLEFYDKMKLRQVKTIKLNAHQRIADCEAESNLHLANASSVGGLDFYYLDKRAGL